MALVRARRRARYSPAPSASLGDRVARADSSGRGRPQLDVRVPEHRARRATDSRGRQPLHPRSLLLADIDHFKTVNDRFGHDVGDRILARFAEILRCIARDADVLARLGGEEFGVLMPETDRHEAAAFAGRLRRALAEPGATHPRITVSIGIAQAEAELADIPALMKRADIALYDAKRQGRDRVAVAGGTGRQVA